MVWVRTERERFINRIGRLGWRDVGRFDCDHCHRIFCVLKPQQLKPLKNHFCGAECKRAFRSERSAKLWDDALVELVCDNSKCGRRFFRHRNLIDRDDRRSGLHFCCNACVGASDELRRMKEATCEEKYGSGIRHHMQDRDVKIGMQSTMVSRYGAPHALQVPELFDRSVRSTIEHYGVWPAVKSPVVQATIDHVERNRKLRERLLREGRLWISKPEKELGEFLVRELGAADVLAQVFIADRSVDFCVRSLKLYVQMDGVYWHGLVEAGRGRSDVVEAMRKDRQQDAWFAAQDELRLFRISDLQWQWVVENSAHTGLLEQMRSIAVVVNRFDCPVPYFVHR